jgi:hypothetical protein
LFLLLFLKIYKQYTYSITQIIYIWMTKNLTNAKY